MCDRQVVTTGNICQACARHLPWVARACQRCGDGSRQLALLDGCCGRCLLHAPPFQSCHGLFHYQSPVDQLLTAFKYHERLDIGFALSALLAQRMQDHYRGRPRPDVVLAVPLHVNRLRTRGYNQALESARVVARRLQIPLCLAGVQRVRDTQPQTAMVAAGRRSLNLRGAFRVDDRFTASQTPFVALIDDVVTTTATVRTLGLALVEAGVSRIDVWCLARASRG